jgi:hypothetical protein
VSEMVCSRQLSGFTDEVLEDARSLPIAASASFAPFRRVPAEIAARQRKPEPDDVYIPQYSGRTLAEIDAEHERMRWRMRLERLKRE